MFVRCKVRDGRAYHYLVATVRDGGRVRQKTVAYLGDYPTATAALEGLPAEIAKLREEAHECAARADRVRLYLGAGTLERHGGEVPRPAQIRSMSQHGRKICAEYWDKHDRAELCDKLIRQKTKQLNKLRAACSAHNSVSEHANVGTTRKATGGELRVRWAGRSYVRAWQTGPVRVCYLDRVSPSGRLRVVCLLTSRSEAYFEKPDLNSEIRFWKRVAAKLDGVRLSDSERAAVEAQIALAVPRPSEDAIRKYDEGEAALWGGLRKMRLTREAAEHSRWEASQVARANRAASQPGTTHGSPE